MSSAASNQVTQLLARWGEGDEAAREALIPVVYQELRRGAGCVTPSFDEAIALPHKPQGDPVALDDDCPHVVAAGVTAGRPA